MFKNGMHKDDPASDTPSTTEETNDSHDYASIVLNVDDDTKWCVICVKKLKLRRCCNHCSKCFVIVCDKHEECKHPIGTLYPVRGFCVCNICL
mmetsp:Transcript_34873/g.35051  ORF Transcript_34873/g.35051 Transcript_34873/m.35051 type:complete len:93 (+) Transcript_34873:73-351(+)